MHTRAHARTHLSTRACACGCLAHGHAVEQAGLHPSESDLDTIRGALNVCSWRLCVVYACVAAPFERGKQKVLGSTFWVEPSSSEKKSVAQIKGTHGTVNTSTFLIFVWFGFLSRLWCAKRDVGFVIGFLVRNGLGFCLVWGFSVTFVAHEARMERDVGFVIR